MSKKEGFILVDQLRDFTHFVAAEEENLLKAIANLGKDFFLIQNLDYLYLYCLKLEPIDRSELEIPIFLYLNSHREFYLGMISFLRLHISKSYCCLRSALDSVFTAYYLLKYPEKIKAYLSKITQDKNSEWDKIFRNIKKTIKQNIEKFPRAKNLPEIHDFCSIYSHPDALGILQRYDIDKEKSMLTAEYFDYQSSQDLLKYKRQLTFILSSFFKIYLVFWNEIFKQRAGDKLLDMEKGIAAYYNQIQLFMKKNNIPCPTILTRGEM